MFSKYRHVFRLDIRSFMDAYKTEPALAVHWIFVGPNGRRYRPVSGGVLPYYTRCADQPDIHVKTIVNTFYLESLAVHPHNFHYLYASLRCSNFAMMRIMLLSLQQRLHSSRCKVCPTLKMGLGLMQQGELTSETRLILLILAAV
jgi:hypothetical protein